MKKYIILLCVTLGVMTSSCTKDEVYNVENAVAAGIDKHDDNYTSWIVVMEDDVPHRYQVVLNYPREQQVLLPDMYVSGIVLKDIVRTEDITDSETDNGITKYTKLVSYNFQFADFTIPVSYTEEYAVWSSFDGSVTCQMPAIKTDKINTEISFTSLPFERIDGRLYSASTMLLEVFDYSYIYSYTEVKCLSSTGISLDDSYNEHIHEIFI